MRRATWLFPVLLLAACGGGKSMMVLEDKVFDLVTAEDRAVLDSPRAAVTVAEDKRDQAKKAPDTAAGDLSGARKARDLANLAAAAAGAKVDAIEASVAYLKAEAEAADHEVEAAKAKYQWERARLAASKGLKPYEGFSEQKFEKQYLDYQKAFVTAQEEAAKKKSAMQDAAKNYEEAQKKHDKAKD